MNMDMITKPFAIPMSDLARMMTPRVEAAIGALMAMRVLNERKWTEELPETTAMKHNPAIAHDAVFEVLQDGKVHNSTSIAVQFDVSRRTAVRWLDAAAEKYPIDVFADNRGYKKYKIKA